MSEIVDRRLRSVLRPYWDAGWTVSAVLWCLDHKPSGELWPHTDAVRHVPGWVRYRLAPWTGLASPSQQRAAGHEVLLAEQARRGAEWAAVRAAAADACRAHAARARQLLRRSPVAARTASSTCGRWGDSPHDGAPVTITATRDRTTLAAPELDLTDPMDPTGLLDRRAGPELTLRPSGERCPVVVLRLEALHLA